MECLRASYITFDNCRNDRANDENVFANVSIYPFLDKLKRIKYIYLMLLHLIGMDASIAQAQGTIRFKRQMISKPNKSSSRLFSSLTKCCVCSVSTVIIMEREWHKTLLSHVSHGCHSIARVVAFVRVCYPIWTIIV